MNELYFNLLPDFIREPGSRDWNYLNSWGFRLITTYNPIGQEYLHWREDKSLDLYSYLRSFDLIIAYNWNDFDAKILHNFKNLNGFSVMQEVQKIVGHRLKLQTLAKANDIPCEGDLAEFLDKEPDLRSCGIFNMSKIQALVKLMEKSVVDEYLYYFTPSEYSEKCRMDTKTWKKILDQRRMPF